MEIGMAGPKSVVKLQKQTFGARIAEKLREAILTGEIAPGAPIIEMTLAAQFGVSRGPLREAIRQLIDEGLLVQIPFTGTHVTDLSEADVREIYSLRTTIEIFAFELIWERRDAAFAEELRERQSALAHAIDAGDEMDCIRRELHLHALAYETADHHLLLNIWNGLRGRLQLYWASHHLAHGRRGPRRTSHDGFVTAALGDDLDTLRAEIRGHMRLGADETERFIAARQPRIPSRKAPHS
jgi:DNA-binding GntR family transcriptional regulator